MCIKFNRLFQLSLFQHDSLWEVCREWGEIMHQDKKWRSPLKEWEKVELNLLNIMIIAIKLSSTKDKPYWMGNNSTFTVRDCYKAITKEGERQDNSMSFWKYKIPNNITISLWKVQLKILPTKRFISGKILVSDPRCVWCKVEDADWFHLLWDCNYTKTLWHIIFSWWNLNPQIIKPNDDLLKILRGMVSSKISIGAWIITLSLSLWHLWKSRNKLMFQNSIQEPSLIFHQIKEEVRFWCIHFRFINPDISSLWYCDPVASIQNTIKARRNHLIHSLTLSYELVAFCDGAWKQGLGGIEGYLISKEKTIVYLCSRPSCGNTVIHVELEAISNFLTIMGNFNNNAKGLICTNFKQLEVLFCKAKAGNNSHHELFGQIKKHAQYHPNIQIPYISRNWNQAADELAKEGLKINRILYSWV